MDITRRDLALIGSLTALLAPLAARTSAAQAPETAFEHDMSAFPPEWMGSEQIAFLIYPEFTALDMVGPHHMLTSLMGSKTHIVAKTRDPVKSDTGLVFMPSMSFDECPGELDIICVPGGAAGTLAAIQDEATLAFLASRGAKAKYVTSVCTGSLLLGAAGLLQGYKATSHWAALDVLSEFGVTPTAGRVVRDRNRITGGGVTAGIDFGLYLVGQLRDKTYAEGVQLLAEYAPDPPYHAGTPDTAPPHVRQMMEAMMVDFVVKIRAAGKASFATMRDK